MLVALNSKAQINPRGNIICVNPLNIGTLGMKLAPEILPEVTYVEIKWVNS